MTINKDPNMGFDISKIYSGVLKSFKGKRKLRSCVCQAKIVSIGPWSKSRLHIRFIVDKYGKWDTTFPKNIVEEYKLSNVKNLGKAIQVLCLIGKGILVGRDNDEQESIYSVVPTFFDFSSRCKKCGRFYKIYCRKCYQEFKLDKYDYRKRCECPADKKGSEK